MENSNIITKFQSYDFNSETFQHLNVFLEMKNKFITDNSLNSRIDMKLAYDNIYHDIKHAMVAKIITNDTFTSLVDLLQEGLWINIPK